MNMSQHFGDPYYIYVMLRVLPCTSMYFHGCQNRNPKDVLSWDSGCEALRAGEAEAGAEGHLGEDLKPWLEAFFTLSP